MPVNKRTAWLYIGTILCTLWILVACTEQGDDSDQWVSTNTSTVETILLPTSTSAENDVTETVLLPTSTPTERDNLVNTPTVSLPELDVFLGDAPLATSCLLPCWHGLRVGVSTLDDLEQVFYTELGFDETVDILRLPPPDTVASPPSDNELLIVVESEGQAISDEVIFRLNRQTLILEQISFNPFPNNVGLTPIDFFQTLGSPSTILFKTFPTSLVTAWSSQVLLVYEDGIVASFETLLDAQIIGNSQEGFYRIEYCLNEYTGLESLAIIEPIATVDAIDWPRLGPWYQSDSFLSSATSVEDMFDIEYGTFIDQVLVEEDSCFVRDIEY